MKTLIKKHMVWMFALVLGIGTMSFKLAEKKNLSQVWFPTNAQGEINRDNPLPSPPTGCDAGNDYCAVAFTPESLDGGRAPISNAFDDPHNLIVGEAKWN